MTVCGSPGLVRHTPCPLHIHTMDVVTLWARSIS